MSVELEPNHDTGLLISNFNSKNIYPLLPLLSQEFNNWSLVRIKNYINRVISNKKDASNQSGILVAQNDGLYYVGILIYSYQSITSSLLKNNNDFSNHHPREHSNEEAHETQCAQS